MFLVGNGCARASYRLTVTITLSLNPTPNPKPGNTACANMKEYDDVLRRVNRSGDGNLWLGSKVRGSGGQKSPSGFQGRSPGRGSGDEVTQKLKHFLKNRY